MQLTGYRPLSFKGWNGWNYLDSWISDFLKNFRDARVRECGPADSWGIGPSGFPKYLWIFLFIWTNDLQHVRNSFLKCPADLFRSNPPLHFMNGTSDLHQDPDVLSTDFLILTHLTRKHFRGSLQMYVYIILDSLQYLQILYILFLKFKQSYPHFTHFRYS